MAGRWKEGKGIIIRMVSKSAIWGIKIDGYWYYFDASGVMKQNYWRQKDGQLYYYDADGHMYQNAGAQLDGYWLLF